MTDRLEKIYKVLPPCQVFADIGCDHGYLALAMIEGGKCEKAIISDISEKCLKKAENLLEVYIKKDLVKSVVSNGFDKVEGCDVALIAGMGGEEICDILTRANTQQKLPEKLVIQPMKNCDKARVVAVSLGYKIDYDKVFKSAGKYYNLIVLTKGVDHLTEDEIEFGRDNVRLVHDDFKDMLMEEKLKFKQLLNEQNITDAGKLSLENKIKKLEKYV